MNKKFLAAILIGFAAVFWGVLGLPIKKLNCAPMWIVWFRLTGNVVVLVALNLGLFTGKGLPRARELGVGVLLFFSALTWTLGTPLTTAGNGAVLSNVAPFFALATEVLFYRYKARKDEWLLLTIMLVSLGLMSDGLSLRISGDLLIVASGAFFGVALALSSKLPQGGYIRSLVWGQTMGVLFVPVYFGLRECSPLPPCPASSAQFVWLGVMIIVGSGGYYFHSKATVWNVLPGHINSAILMTQSVAATVIGLACLGEQPAFRGAIGSCALLWATFMLVTSKNGNGSESK